MGRHGVEFCTTFFYQGTHPRVQVEFDKRPPVVPPPAEQEYFEIASLYGNDLLQAAFKLAVQHVMDHPEIDLDEAADPGVAFLLALGAAVERRDTSPALVDDEAVKFVVNDESTKMFQCAKHHIWFKLGYHCPSCERESASPSVAAKRKTKVKP